MIIQHSDVRDDTPNENFYARGMKSGREAAKLNPGWDDGELAQQSANKAIIYLMSAPEGAVQYMKGFEKGYRASR
jgi:hypothetical protein